MIDSSTLLCNRYTDAHTRHRETKDRVCATPDSVSIPALRPGSELTAVVMLLLQAVKKTATEYTSQGEGRRGEGGGGRGQVWAAWQDTELLPLKDKRNSSVTGRVDFTSPDINK